MSVPKSITEKPFDDTELKRRILSYSLGKGNNVFVDKDGEHLRIQSLGVEEGGLETDIKNIVLQLCEDMILDPASISGVYITGFRDDDVTFPDSNGASTKDPDVRWMDDSEDGTLLVSLTSIYTKAILTGKTRGDFEEAADLIKVLAGQDDGNCDCSSESCVRAVFGGLQRLGEFKVGDITIQGTAKQRREVVNKHLAHIKEREIRLDKAIKGTDLLEVLGKRQTVDFINRSVLDWPGNHFDRR